jgi:cellulose synthase/poly-beta-1,6-N-acetylglucosamine synthase-like glycosyltransferase
MALPVIILLFTIYGYTLLMLLFYLEIEQDPDPAGDLMEHPQSVSVVVPFRNEEDHLPGLLEDFTRQSFPVEHLEIIFVDDHSRDGSASILESLKDENVHFRYLSLPPGMSGKKRALSYGISHAEHEWIIQVDADCRVGPGFVSAHMTFLEKHPSDLVAGIVTTGKGKGNFLEIFERLDILGLAGAGAGSFNLGRPMMCSGANLSYSRKLYSETRSFDPETIVASGDDMFMMIGARKLGKTLSFICDRESIVRTAPQKDLRTLLAQRIRWGSKAGRYKILDIQLLAFLVSLTNVSILLMPVWIILFSPWWPWLAGAWMLKTLADFMLLFRMTGISGSRSELKMFLPVSLLYYPYFLVTVLGALWGRSVWKSTLK